MKNVENASRAPRISTSQTEHIDHTVIGYGNVFPGGNGHEVLRIKGMLEKLNVNYRTVDLTGGGAIFIIDESEVEKLPQDEEGTYLPADQASGYKLIEIEQCMVDHMRSCGFIVGESEKDNKRNQSTQ